MDSQDDFPKSFKDLREERVFFNLARGDGRGREKREREMEREQREKKRTADLPLVGSKINDGRALSLAREIN
jgi:hypothetical protein